MHRWPSSLALVSLSFVFLACHHSANGKAAPAPVVVEPATAHVTLMTQGAGRVTSFPVGIDCGATCTATFRVGDSVALYAQPSPGATFTGWSLASCSGAQCGVALTGDLTLTATFTASLNANISSVGPGTGEVTVVSGDPSCVASGGCTQANEDSLTLTATPDPGFVFSGWRGACSGTGTCVISSAAASAVQAVFVGVYTWYMNTDDTRVSIVSTGLSGQSPRTLVTLVASQFTGVFASSADGTAIAYSSLQTNAKLDGAPAVTHANLWLMDVTSGAFSNLTGYNGPAEVVAAAPAFAADGTLIAFVSDRDTASSAELKSASNLWVSDRAGHTTPLTHYTTSLLLESADDSCNVVAWAPDHRLAFVSKEAVAEDSGATTYYNLWVVNADGSSRTRLTHFNSHTSASEPAVRCMSWSPDGSRIAFASEEDPQGVGAAPAPLNFANIWTVDVQSGKRAVSTHVTTTQDALSDPLWAPRANAIVYASRKPPPGATASFSGSNLWAIHPDGTGETLLTGNVSDKTENTRPHWFLDGATLLYESFSGPTQVSVNVYRTDLAGSAPTVVTNASAGTGFFVPTDFDF